LRLPRSLKVHQQYQQQQRQQQQLPSRRATPKAFKRMRLRLLRGGSVG
jgi:hypothetical protein